MRKTRIYNNNKNKRSQKVVSIATSKQDKENRDSVPEPPHCMGVLVANRFLRYPSFLFQILNFHFQYFLQFS